MCGEIGHEVQRGAGPRWRAGRALSAAGLVAGLLALASASPASAEVVVSHAAKSGELRDGRLILRGVSGRAGYVTDAGRSGTTSVRRMHQRAFPPGKPAIGTLHIAGSGGGQEPAFRLSKPRYDASRRIVSYKARALQGTSASSTVARSSALPAPRRFGAASLSILPHPSLASGGGGGHDCIMQVGVTPGGGAANLRLQSSANWDTDVWTMAPPSDILVADKATMESQGGLWRGCGFSTVWESLGATITVAVSWPWNDAPTTSCTVSGVNRVHCNRDDVSVIGWDIVGGPG